MNHSERSFQKLAWDHRRTKRHVKPINKGRSLFTIMFYFKKLFNSSKDSLYFCTLASFQTMVMYINTQLSIYWLEKRYRRPIKSKRYVIFLFLGRQFSSTEVIFLIFCIKYSDVLKRWILFDSLSVSVFRLSEVNERFEGK